MNDGVSVALAMLKTYNEIEKDLSVISRLMAAEELRKRRSLFIKIWYGIIGEGSNLC